MRLGLGERARVWVCVSVSASRGSQGAVFSTMGTLKGSCRCREGQGEKKERCARVCGCRRRDSGAMLRIAFACAHVFLPLTVCGLGFVKILIAGLTQIFRKGRLGGGGEGA